MRCRLTPPFASVSHVSPGWVAVWALAGALLAASCSKPEGAADAGNAQGTGAAASGKASSQKLGGGSTANGNGGAPATPVEVQVVGTQQVESWLTLHAELQALRHTRVASGSGGPVEAVLVDAGDTVRDGQVLARVGAKLGAAQLRQAQAALEQAQAEFDRTKKLAAQKLASAAALQQAKSAYAQAQAAHEVARVRYDDAVITAPHAGRVAQRGIEPGEQAAPGQPLFELIDLSTLKAIAQLPERDLPYVQAGRPAQLMFDALPGQVFATKVHRIGVVAAEHSRTFDLEVRLTKPPANLRPGMLARVQILKEVLANVPVVRRDAVIETLRGSSLFVVKDGVAEQRLVKLGQVDKRAQAKTPSNTVAVVEGLAADELVVVVGQRTVAPGANVTVTTTHPAIKLSEASDK